MNHEKIEAVLEEITRFQHAAAMALKELREMDREHWVTGSKRSGTLRRASLDLTRALADMRKSG